MNTDMTFCQLVNARVLEQYQLDDGGALCFNLLESGVIRGSATVDEAARIVAMHMSQV